MDQHNTDVEMLRESVCLNQAMGEEINQITLEEEYTLKTPVKKNNKC